jgi:hypothetical protein
MHIEVTVFAACASLGKDEAGVTGNTGDGSVPSGEREFRLLMIELQVRPQVRPSFGGVTRAASHAERSVGVLYVSVGAVNNQNGEKHGR